MRKRTLIPFLVAALLALTGAERDLGTGYELENVEVMDPLMRLKDAREYMIQFNEALGVQCRDCHDLKDFASDDNELKLAARDMMKMQVEIHETWFPEAEAEVVTCWTCHRGERTPPDRSGLGSLLPAPADSDSAADSAGQSP